MSCRTSALLLLLLVGIGMASATNYVSNNVTRAHRIVVHHLNLTKPEVGNDPLFSFIRSNISCQRKHSLFSKTLDIYSRIFSIILDKTRTSALLEPLSGEAKKYVKTNLNQLQEMMEGLKNETKGNSLSEEAHLNSIKVDEVKYQKKALAEFKEVYQAAHVCYHRRHMAAGGSTHSA